MTQPPYDNDPENTGDDSPTPPKQDPLRPEPTDEGGSTPSSGESARQENASPYGTGWQSPDSSSKQHPGYSNYGSGQQDYSDSQQPYGAAHQSYGTGQTGYGPASAYPSYGAPAADPADNTRGQGKGFFSALFDFSFDNFVAVKFARVIYIIAVILAAATLLFGWLLPSLAMFGESFFGGIALLLFAWIPVGLIALVQLVFIRVFLEFVISSVKTAENTSKLVEQGTSR
jgi:hypothetical protein